MDRKRGRKNSLNPPQGHGSLFPRVPHPEIKTREQQQKKTHHHNWLLSGSPALQIWVHSPRPPNVAPGPLACCSPTAITPDSVFLSYTLAIYSRFLRGRGWGRSVYLFQQADRNAQPSTSLSGSQPSLTSDAQQDTQEREAEEETPPCLHPWSPAGGQVGGAIWPAHPRREPPR